MTRYLDNDIGVTIDKMPDRKARVSFDGIGPGMEWLTDKIVVALARKIIENAPAHIRDAHWEATLSYNVSPEKKLGQLGASVVNCRRGVITVKANGQTVTTMDVEL